MGRQVRMNAIGLVWVVAGALGPAFGQPATVRPEAATAIDDAKQRAEGALAQYRRRPTPQTRQTARGLAAACALQRMHVAQTPEQRRAILGESAALQKQFMDDAFKRYEKDPTPENRADFLKQANAYYRTAAARAGTDAEHKRLFDEYVSYQKRFLDDAMARYRKDPTPQNRDAVQKLLDQYAVGRMAAAGSDAEADRVFGEYMNYQKEFMEKAVDRYKQNPTHENLVDAEKQVSDYAAARMAVVTSDEEAKRVYEQYTAIQKQLMETAVERYEKDPSAQNLADARRLVDDYYQAGIAGAETQAEEKRTYDEYAAMDDRLGKIEQAGEQQRIEAMDDSAARNELARIEAQIRLLEKRRSDLANRIAARKRAILAQLRKLRATGAAADASIDAQRRQLLEEYKWVGGDSSLEKFIRRQLDRLRRLQRRLQSRIA